MSIKVLVVDDQRLFRQSLSGMLKQDPEIRIVGEAADGQEAFYLAVEKRPDIILMDLDIPKMDGCQTTRKILDRFPRTKVLILSVLGDGHHVRSGLEAGAVGYILKDADFNEFIRIIKHFAKGLPISSACLTPSEESLSPLPSLNFSTLTRREVEILDIVTQGGTNKEIADRLSISIDTVKVHLQHIYRKLKIKNRVELILSLQPRPDIPSQK